MDDYGRDCGCRSDVSRRDLLKAGAGAAGAMAGAGALRAAPGDIPPAAKSPPPRAWFDQLVQPGEPVSYAGDHLSNLIFPIGGIGTGTIWLHGSGRLVNWQIFNNIQKNTMVDDTFFAVRIEREGTPPMVRVLQQQSMGDFPGIRDLRFVGRYPVATVTFRDPELPVDLELEAFNPMIPLNEKDSGIPCAIFTLRAINKTAEPVRVSLLSSLQNAVGHAGRGSSTGAAHRSYGGNVNYQVINDGMVAVAMKAEPGKPARITPPVELITDHHHLPVLNDSPVTGLSLAGFGEPKTSPGIQTVYWLADGNLRQLGGSILGRIPHAVRELGAVLLLSGVENGLRDRVRPTVPGKVRRRETIFAGFDDQGFGPWTAKGEAFRGPKSGTVGRQSPVTGFLGAGLVNTFDPNDSPKGSLTSPIFTVRDRYISFLIGGGEQPGACCVNLVVDGKVLRSATGKNSEHLERAEWDVSDLIDREARIEILDTRSGGWGHVLLDDLRFSNLPIDAVTTEDADAWNALIDEARQSGAMTAVGMGKGKVMLVPVELASAKAGVDELEQRDQVLKLIASLSGVTYQPQVGRPSNAPSFGTMCLATAAPGASLCVAWSDRDKLLGGFAETGRLVAPERSGGVAEALPPVGPTLPGQTVNAALAVEAVAAPRAAAEATFIFTWNFAHQYYPQNSYRVAGNTAFEVGNMYTNWFRDALSVARYVLSNYDKLHKQTFTFRDAMFDTSLPQYLIDCVAANASIIRSPTCFWAKDGTFFGFEGCRWEGGGCCPMNCNHVWNYEQTLAKLWPELERDMRKTELKYHQRDDGGTNHRVAVPRDNPHKTSPPVADGQCGAVLKAYREHLQSPDRRFLDEYWPMIKKAMDFAISEWDPDGDGVMEKPQFNTYDRVIYGHNSFVSSLYLAALRAAEEMARLSADDGAAGRYRSLFDKGSTRIAQTLFDGEYYIQKADNVNLGYGKGCWSDQVVGQWWARVLDLGDILPNHQVQSALKAVFKHNLLWKTAGFEGTQRFLQFGDGDDKGLLCGSWPKGGRPEDPIYYRDEYWTGIEYQVAAHKIYEGQILEALAMVKAARERYDGRKKSPWNEIECGDYYVRAMSSWSLLLAAQGYAHNGPARDLAFNPRLTPEDHRSLFTTAQGWGRFEQKRTGRTQTAALTISGGRCDLKQLRLRLPAGAGAVKGAARINDRNLVARVTFDKGFAVVDLTSPITAEAGDVVQVTLDWS